MREKDFGIYMQDAVLGNFARNTAASNEKRGKVPGRVTAAGVSRTLKRLKEAEERIVREGVNGSEAKEWLCDNWYIAEREAKSAAAFLKELGALPGSAAERRRPAVSVAASALVSAGRGEITGERIELFLEEYQKVSAMTEKELSAFRASLVAALVTFLEAVSAEMMSRDDGETALLMKNAFTSLRLLAELDMSETLERVNRTEAVLRRDPAGIYPLMDEETRHEYRRELARIAEKAHITEYEAAKRAVELAAAGQERHVGFYILKKPLGEEKRKNASWLYMAAIVLGSLFFSLLAGITLQSVWAALLLLVPLSETVKNAADYLALRLVRPKRLPRLQFIGSLPKEGKTVCVIAALLTGEKDGAKYAGLLEEYRLLNRSAGENLTFGLLADLKESETPEREEDEAVIRGAYTAIEELNREYGGGFYLFLRKRQKSEADGIYMAKERKRGAITELARLLTGRESALSVLCGEKERLAGTNYILTLDADTRLTADSAKELIGTALHPLNTPVIDTRRGVVTEGYGILQPRVSVDLESAGASDFTRIFAGEGGIDPYGAAASDVYQDLFGLGSFTGKGLINVPAYEACLDGAFRENTVLSHDLIEGSYMRCGYVSDVELLDGYPYKITSFFARMHRWTRGDWQNIAWLGGKITNARGEERANPLGDVDRWKIFDNLRRSLVPVTMMAAVLTGIVFGGRVLAITALAAVLGVVSPLLISSASALTKRRGSLGARYHSTIITGAGGMIIKTIIRLMLLPAEAWTQASAIVTALYRLFVSHKNMLQWVTASDAEKKHGNTILVNYRKLAACPIAGLLVLLLARGFAAAFGLVWLFTPAYAWALSRPLQRNAGADEATREYLMACAGDIWRYFADHLTEEDHYLPPDNVQMEPAVGVAHRTSPTNIGLALLSALAAADIGLCGGDEAWELVHKTLGTVSALPKWRGHLYNWYDTRTLKPLKPEYVSTVDSGNLLACLIVIKEAARERRDAPVLKMCVELIETMSLKPLYDAKRRLFTIGWDVRRDAPTEGWYDLMASEARTTSYIACALGDVPRKHWRRLSRAQVSLNRYSGMVSWTGTMFEYLMPNLTLPCYPDSLLYETARFALYVQRRENPGMPWGVSESAFYAFDPGLSYRYKAHGVQRLALKRKMALDSVVAPYASFLALPLEPKAAAENLRRLAKLGAVGKYGFYEAVDFTPSRVGEGRYEVVKTYMAHHLGMSLVAAANTLCGDIMPRRFMADRRMRAYAELLKEKVPIGEVVLRQPTRDVPEKPKRHEEDGYLEKLTGTDALTPASLPLTNGSYAVLLSENGKLRSLWHDLLITRWSPDPLSADGMALYLDTGDEMLPLVPAPEYRRDIRYSAEFKADSGTITGSWGGYAWSVAVSVPASESGEIKRIEIRCSEKAPASCRLVYAFEPVLTRREDFEAHPAFHKLCMEAERDDGALVVRKRARGEAGDVYLCVASDREASFATEAERQNPRESTAFKTSTPQMRVSVSIPLSFSEGKASASIALAVSESRDAAVKTAGRMLGRHQESAITHLGASAVMLGLDTEGIRRALGRIPVLVFPNKRMGQSGALYAKNDLWSLGVSGDLPILAFSVEAESGIEAALQVIREHALLAENGVKADLVLLLTDMGEYRGRQRRAAQELLASLGREHLIGTPGGVHFADAFSHGAAAVRALADLVLDADSVMAPRERRLRTPMVTASQRQGEVLFRVRTGDDGTFTATMRNTLPPVAWANVLANERFGFIATDAGTGNMWIQNAHELKVNRWLCDPLAVRGTETITLLCGEREVSLFCDGGKDSALLEYGLGYAVWRRELGGVKTEVTAFVPPDIAARVLIIRLSGNRETSRIRWATDLVLGAGNEPGREILTRYSGGVFSAEAKTEGFGTVRLLAAASAEPVGFTTDRNARLSGELNGFTGVGQPACIAAEYDVADELVIAVGCEDAAVMRSLCDGKIAWEKYEETKDYWRSRCLPVKVKTPDMAIDDLVNGWALYQTLSSRLLGRTSVYQSGGAYGFRDQLQDVMALTASCPAITQTALLRAAAHQYREGDVMHWWHETASGDRGVRTHISDDLMWLPYVLCDYVARTGDREILQKTVPFLVSEPLSEDEMERYEAAAISAEGDTILHHAMLAAHEFMRRGTGEHGLALMGAGDWNDGMNGVGAAGKGESVWLSWFGAITLERLADLTEKKTPDAAERYRAFARGLIGAAERAWDGEWYLRGYYDDGAKLGSKESGECRIDSIAQSFAVFAGADPEKCRRALTSAVSELFDEERRVVKLFTPPFSDGAEVPGYIKSYAAGFRENGGQYTHAAVWLGMALIRAGRAEEGARILTALTPGGRETDTYKAEPYVLAADIYAAKQNEGRAGWTWYTGSAGWFYRAVTEELLGLKMRGGRLFIEPRLPDSWDGVEMLCRLTGENLTITVGKAPEREITVNGAPYDPDGYPVKVYK